jgi:hypothetical protein
MMTLFPLVWLGRRVNALMGRKRQAAAIGHDDMLQRELRIVPGINGMVSALLGLENRLIARRWPLPLGTSLLAIAKRP